MLYPDSEKRIDDVIELAELAEQKSYHRTANEIRSFVEILKGKKCARVARMNTLEDDVKLEEKSGHFGEGLNTKVKG